jgi:RimK family alpha-L-glutamate ligase
MNYLKQYRQKLPFPKSALIFSSKSIDSIIDKFNFPLIVKASVGRQGRGVFKADSKEELVKKVSKLQETKQSVIIREFIPNDGDIRVFCVGYRAIGAMRRIPKEGEFRSNISLGGKGEKFDLEKYPKVKKLAEKAAKVTATEIAGVDIIIHKETGKPYILEVNPGPQFTGLEKYTGTNAALEIIKYFEKLHSEKAF